MTAVNEVDPSSVNQEGEQSFQLITFTLGEEEYGVDIKSVREIKAWAKTTPLPNTPEFVLGVINIRGSILPVFDLRDRFGQGKTQPTNTHVIIVIALDDQMIGILVDTVSDIVSLTQKDVRPVPDTGDDGENALLKGLATVSERMITLISPENLFGRQAMDDANDFSAHQTAPTESEGAKIPA